MFSILIYIKISTNPASPSGTFRSEDIGISKSLVISKNETFVLYQGDKEVKGSIENIGDRSYLLKSGDNEWISKVSRVGDPTLISLDSKSIKVEAMDKVSDTPIYMRIESK